MHIAFFLYNVYNKRTKIRALKPTKEVLGMSGKVDYNRLINIISNAPGFTLGEYDGILSMDDSYVNDFKSTVILFCIENEQDDTAVIDEIVTTANYDSVTNVIKGLTDGDISDVNDAQCNKFANEFVQEVNRKIKNKKWYHQIVMMQCAIINAIHTIFKECGELLTSVDSRIILGLATSFKHWFENSRIQDSDFYKIKADDSSDIAANIANNVDSFLESKLHLGSNYKIFSVPTDLQQIFTCFKKYYDSDINKWIENYESQVDNCTKNLGHKKDVGNIKTALKIIANNVSKNTKLDDKLITDLSKTLGKVFNVGDIYLIKKEVESSVDFVIKKRDQEKSKSSDNEKKPHSVELEKDKSNTKISATRKLDEQRAEYIDQPESNDDHVAMPEENNQRFKEFLKSFEKNYMNTNDYNWVDTCTQGLGNANDITRLKAQLTNLIKAITRNDWIAASSAMIIGPLSKTLSKIFRVNDDSNDDVKSEINAVIKKQKLLQNFLKALEKSFYPFNANAWWNNLGESTLFSTNLESPLLDFMKCVTGEIDDANINKKTDELSDALCKDFAVNDTGSITTRLNEIVQRVKDMQKSLKEKYGTDIVDNLLKVIDFVAAQGYVDLSSEPSCELVYKELRGFKNLLETADKRQCAVNVIHEVLQGINEGMDSETIAQSSAISLVNSGVINTDDKDKAVKKITSKMQELRNKRKKKSLTTEQNDSAPQPQIVETNTAQVQSPPAPQAKKPELSPEPPKTESVNIDEKIDSITSKIQNDAVKEFIKTFSNTLDRAKLTEQHIGILETFATKLDEKPNILEEEHINNTKSSPHKTYQNHFTEFINLVRKTLNEKNACSPPSQVHAFFAMTDLGYKLYHNKKIEVNDIKNSAPKLSSYLFGENSDMVLKAVEDVETVETVEDANDKARSEELKEQTQNENLRILDNFLDTLANNLGNTNCADEACNVLGGCTYIEKDPIEKFINNVTSAPTSIAQYITNLSNMLEKKLGVTGEEEMIKQRLNQIAAARRLNFKKDGNKVKRFAKRAVNKQERQKHTKQKNKNAEVLIKAIRDIPSTIQEILDRSPQYNNIKLVLNSLHSGLVNNLNNINFNECLAKEVNITEIEKIAKQIRQKIKKDQSAKSDSVVALAVLYKVLTAVKKPEENEEKIKKLFKAFAKWFNKYVSPRSAIRSTEIVQELNRKIGTMAGGGDMFKCGKLTRAKNAIKKIAKKG